MVGRLKATFRKLRKHESIYDAVWNVHWFTEMLFKQSLLSYPDDDGDGKLEPIPKKKPIAACVTIFAMFVIFALNVQMDTTQNQSNSVLMRNSARVLFVAVSVNLSFVALLNMFARHNLVAMLKDFGKFDDDLLRLGYRINLKVQNTWLGRAVATMTVWFFFIISVVLYTVIKFYGSNYGASVTVFLISLVLNVVITSQNILMLVLQYLIQYRFGDLNDYFSSLLPTDDTQVNLCRLKCLARNQGVLIEQIVQISVMYSHLTRIVGIFLSSYGKQLTLAVLACTLTTIMSSFTLYRAVVDPEHEGVYFSVNGFCWSMYYMFCQLSTIVLASWTKSKAKQLGILIHKAMNFCKDDTICSTLLLVSSHVDHEAPRMSVRLFELDKPIILSIIGSISTYLVILIQFDLDPGVLNLDSSAVQQMFSNSSTNWTTTTNIEN